MFDDVIGLAGKDLFGFGKLGHKSAADTEDSLALLGIEAFDESRRGIGGKAKSIGCVTDGGTVEVCDLNDDVLGLFGDGAGFGGHDAGKAHWDFVAGDNEIAFDERIAFLIHRDVFAFEVFSDDEFPLWELIGIVHVDRLTGEKHDEVANVDDVVDGTNAHGGEDLAHPFWGWFSDNTFDFASSEELALLGYRANDEIALAFGVFFVFR